MGAQGGRPALAGAAVRSHAPSGPASGAPALHRIFRPECVAPRFVFFLVLVGPSILLATGFFTLSIGFARTLPHQLITAFAESIIGLAVGFVAAVYVLGGW
jgi:hypothetical protein